MGCYNKLKGLLSCCIGQQEGMQLACIDSKIPNVQISKLVKLCLYLVSIEPLSKAMKSLIIIMTSVNEGMLKSIRVSDDNKQPAEQIGHLAKTMNRTFIVQSLGNEIPETFILS